MNIKKLVLSLTFIFTQLAYANPSSDYIYNCLGAIDQKPKDHDISFNAKTKRFQYRDNTKSRVTHKNFRSRLVSAINSKSDYFEEMKKVYASKKPSGFLVKKLYGSLTTKSSELPVAKSVWIAREEIAIVRKIDAINYAPRCRGLDGRTYKALKLKRAFLKEVLQLKRAGKSAKQITAHFTQSK